MSESSKSTDIIDSLRPTVAEIDLNALEENFCDIRRRVAFSRIMPILKANAYGHGLIPCAKLLEEAGSDYFGVAFLEEAVALREAGIRTPILALGGISGRQIDGFLEHDIDITASSTMKLEAVEQRAGELGKKARIHLKIDTGMERIGVHHYTADTLLEESLKCKNCEIVGLFSHFAAAEDEDLAFARLQLERFLECASFFEKHSLPMPIRHIANSGAIAALPESHLDMVRPGLILWGISPVRHLKELVPQSRVMSLVSEVAYFKVVREGVGLSYDLTWTAPCQTRVVTIPIGYGDGYPRALSNTGNVLIRGKRYPIVGKVCMDQLMVDIGPEGEAYNGDPVTLIGRQGEEEIRVEEIAEQANTDPRDILLSSALRVPRRFHYRDRTFVE